MNDREWLAGEFDGSRPYLHAVAYRMLGSSSEADDAVQEAWLRLDRTNSESIEDLRAWLTTVVGRICLDMLRSRQSRRTYSQDEHMPEPATEGGVEGNPEDDAVLADSVGMALLVVLETLSPAERLAFVLHDVFGVGFDQIAGILGRTALATRQLASRARRRVRGTSRSYEGMRAQRRVVDAFLAAARAGDFEALISVLHPEVVFRLDRDMAGRLAPDVVSGSQAVARRVLARSTTLAPLARPAIVNGAPGAVVMVKGRTIAVVGFTVVDGRIVGINLITEGSRIGQSNQRGSGK